MTSLANRGNTEITDYSGIDFESDGNEDIKPSFPVVKLVQGVSTMKGAKQHIGEFWHSDSETFEPTIDVVGLFKRDTRAYFPKGAVEPTCASNDGVVPRPEQPLWLAPIVLDKGTPQQRVVEMSQPLACADCPFSAWGDDSAPPPCREAMVLLVDRNPEGEPDLAQVRFGGADIKPYKRFVAKKLAPKKLPIYTQALHLTSEEKQANGNNWMGIVLEGEPLPRERVMAYVDLLRAERARFEQGIQHDAEPATENVWGDGKESFTGHRTPPVDADGVVTERRTPTPSPLSRTAAEMFPKSEQG